VKGRHFYLYVLLDLFSRYVVGWMIAGEKNAALAKRLMAESIAKHGIEPGALVTHSDRGGPPMVSKTVAQLLAELDVAQSFSRPHTSNGKPFSEMQFRNTKYRPPELPSGGSSRSRTRSPGGGCSFPGTTASIATAVSLS